MTRSKALHVIEAKLWFVQQREMTIEEGAKEILEALAEALNLGPEVVQLDATLRGVGRMGG